MSVRVRFAPSPTGYLHIGNARAALINWLFCRKNNGEFILRLDDTDLARSKEEYANAIKEDLLWLGLNHDLFFKQSDRFERYEEIKNWFIQTQRLYPCFETKEELDFKRKRQLSKGKPPIYDREALELTTVQIKQFEKDGRKPHWRFKLNPGKIQWHDLIRGEVSFNAEDMSDPILIREDGAFLYTMTSVIDDFDYKITHILRGEDHVTNTAVQVQIFQALNDDLTFPVQFGHTTLLVDADGSPLSKRLGSLSLKSFQEIAIEPQSINSLLARLGTSLPVEPHLTLDTLAQNFELSSFSRTPPRFSLDDLKKLNHKLYHQMPFSLIQEKLYTKNITKITEDVWDMVHDNIDDLDDLKNWENILFGHLEGCSNFDDDDRAYIQEALNALPGKPWDINTWAIWTTQLKEKTGRKGKNLFMPLRKALTNMEHGPEMSKVIFHIGYDEACTRLKSTIRIDNMSKMPII
jgi:glutamyl-tRNA synthetase